MLRLGSREDLVFYLFKNQTAVTHTAWCMPTRLLCATHSLSELETNEKIMLDFHLPRCTDGVLHHVPCTG